MKKGQASITAEGIALVRAMESEKPAGERICYDPLARSLISPGYRLLGWLFAGYGESRAPGVTGFLAARTRHIDEILLSSIRGGIQQLVILGAGLDSRAYRIDGLRGRVKVFELDHPATQQVKINRLKKLFGQIPQQDVIFVPIDFAETTLEECLPAAGYDERAKTLFLWEGVTYYISSEAVDATLHFVSQHSGKDSSIVFDYIYAEALSARRLRGEVARMRRYRGITGEGLDFGIPEGTIEEFLNQRGFDQVCNANSADLKRLYFSGLNQGRAVAPIYAIVHARVRDLKP